MRVCLELLSAPTSSTVPTKNTQKHIRLCYFNKGFQEKKEQPMLMNKDTGRERRVQGMSR